MMIRWPEKYVKITHVPTGVQFISAEQRTQMKNKEVGMQVIKAKVWARQNLDESKKDVLIRHYWLKDDHFA